MYGIAVPYFQTSSLNGTGIQEAAVKLASDIHNKRKSRGLTIVERPASVKLKTDQQLEKKAGCSC
jgi:two-component sensor histidine kinase